MRNSGCVQFHVLVVETSQRYGTFHKSSYACGEQVYDLQCNPRFRNLPGLMTDRSLLKFFNSKKTKPEGTADMQQSASPQAQFKTTHPGMRRRHCLLM